MNAVLLSPGKPRLPGAEQLLEHYRKALAPLLPISLRWTKSAEPSYPVEEQQRREAAELLKAAPAGWVMIALEIEGRRYDSPGLATWLTRVEEQSPPGLVFLVGGPWGLHPSVSQRAQHLLSLSDLTLPHDLARVFLLEQLYRAACIQRGHPYHK